MSSVSTEYLPATHSRSGCTLRRAKRTKVLATVGPATASQAQLKRMIEAGVNVFRINFSHGTHEQHEEYLHNIRAAEAQIEQPVAVCADLCGPKIRVGMLQDGKVRLDTGQRLIVQRAPIVGSAERISTTFAELVDVVVAGDKLLLADGRLKLEVVETMPPEEFVCLVQIGGDLSDGKGVNLPDTEIPISALTEKDRRDVDWISSRPFDYVALSFVQRADDVVHLRELLLQRECAARIIAKIEKPRSLQRIDEIIEVADAVMIARGDLGVEMKLSSVPIAQKSIARKCQVAAKPYIIATEMLESMIRSPTPTRAEISDIANAVFDHADAVMLSAESSIGQYPRAAVATMSETVHAAEDHLEEDRNPLQVAVSRPITTASIAGAIRQIMKSQDIAAVAMYTDTGTTARLISKNRPNCPVLALAREMSTVRRCCLYYGVTSRRVDAPQGTYELLKVASTMCKQLCIANVGDRIIVVAGQPMGVRDHTNGLIIAGVE